MRCLTYLLIALGLALLAGCELPVSKHPLSNAETSQLDERLVGHWEMIPPPEHVPGPSDVSPRFLFARVAGQPNIVECVFTELNGEGLAEVKRIPLYPTKLGELHYLSMAMNPTVGPEDQDYLIMLYEVEGNAEGAEEAADQELRFYLMNKDVIGPAIEREDIRGEVKKDDPDPNAPPPEQIKPKYRHVKITAEPQELAAFLQRRGKAAFNMTQFQALRRIEPK